MKIAPVELGKKRQWVKCNKCECVAYYDFTPYSLSNPIMTMPCGHGLGIDSTTPISADDALVRIAATTSASQQSQHSAGTPGTMTKVTDAEQIEAMCERNEARRFKADQRAWDRMGQRLDHADALIGELNGGKFYINQRNKAGRLTGRAVIFGNRQDAFDYLLRNNYV